MRDSEIRLAVDVNAFRRSRAGIARYLRDILVQVVLRYPEIRLFLYSTSEVDPLLPSGNWQLRADCRARIGLGSIWLQQTCPRWLASDGVDAFWGQHLLPLRLRRPCRRVLTVHDLTSFVLPGTMSIGSRFAARSFLRESIRLADYVFADSRSTAVQIERYYCFGESSISVLYPGLGQAVSDLGADGAVQELSRLGVGSDYILTVGTIEPRKGYDCLLDALDLLSNAPKLVIVGAYGWRCRSTSRRIRSMEESGRVRYLGRVSDRALSALYGGARLLVLPSLYEGFGLPVLEAMACGCPVLCSWSSSLPEVGGSAVRYFKPGSSTELAERLRELLADRMELVRMSSRGSLRASRFRAEASADRLVRAVRESVVRTV